MEASEEVILLEDSHGGGRSSGGYHGGYSGGGGGYHHHHSHYGWGYRPYYSYGYGYGPGGNLFVEVIVVIIVIIIMMAFIRSSSVDNSVAKSTKQRQALSGAVNKTEWYEDNIGWIGNKNTLIDGLEEFYKLTGVQPYILFVPYSSTYWNNGSINAQAADSYMEKVYKEKFNDEAHFIFAYFQCQLDSKSEMDGEFRYLSGYSADSIMDNEAINIFWGYFENNYYNTSLSLEKMISNTFSQTAKNIMSRPTNGWDVFKVLGSIVGVIIILIVIYKIFKKKTQRDKEKEEYTKEILSKPLETFGKDTSDLEDKYK